MSLHIIPINDLKEHEESSTCECFPKLIIENGEMIFVHNAYDNREIIEEFNQILNNKNKYKMQKISTLFKKNHENLWLVINETNPENQWVFDGEGIPTRKYDGTAVAIIKGEIYKRSPACRCAGFKHGNCQCGNIARILASGCWA